MTVKRYVVQQPFRGVATFLVEASSAKEALDKVNELGGEAAGVECVDRDATWIGKAVWARKDGEKPARQRGEP
jgi:hypothetical protein